MFKIIRWLFGLGEYSRYKSKVTDNTGGVHDPKVGPSMDKKSLNYDPEAYRKLHPKEFDKKGKWLGVLLVLFLLGGCVSGCEFLAGFGSGAVAMQVLAEDAQKKFIATVNEVNAEQAKMQELIDQIEDAELKAALQGYLNEETAAAIEKLKKADWKDPAVWGGYSLALMSLLTAAYQKKKRIDEGRMATP